MPLACRNLNFAAPLSLKCLESWQDKHGKVAPSKLTDGELFVLVAYALDVRKKDSGHELFFKTVEGGATTAGQHRQRDVHLPALLQRRFGEVLNTPTPNTLLILASTSRCASSRLVPAVQRLQVVTWHASTLN